MSAILDTGLTIAQLRQCHVHDLLDRMLDSASIMRAATVYRARCGSRKVFPSQEEALAFEAGYDAYRWGQNCPADKPASTGWLEAERADDDARDMRDDERREQERRA